jgi:hypothetical protein
VKGISANRALQVQSSPYGGTSVTFYLQNRERQMTGVVYKHFNCFGARFVKSQPLE